jgi:hypothetical protein
MRATRITLKDGRQFSGPLWTWRPTEGWFTVVDEEGVNGGNPIEIKLSEVESAVNLGQMVHPGVVEDVDLLAQARKDGWQG